MSDSSTVQFKRDLINDCLLSPYLDKFQSPDTGCSFPLRTEGQIAFRKDLRMRNATQEEDEEEARSERPTDGRHVHARAEFASDWRRTESERRRRRCSVASKRSRRQRASVRAPPQPRRRRRQVVARRARVSSNFFGRTCCVVKDKKCVRRNPLRTSDRRGVVVREDHLQVRFPSFGRKRTAAAGAAARSRRTCAWRRARGSPIFPGMPSVGAAAVPAPPPPRRRIARGVQGALYMSRIAHSSY